MTSNNTDLFSYRSGGQKSDVFHWVEAKVLGITALPSEEVPGEDLFPCFFQHLKFYSLHSMAHGPFLHDWWHRIFKSLSTFVATSLSGFLWSNPPLPPSYKGTSDLGHTWMI